MTFTLTDIPSPVSDWQTYVVQARSSDSCEIRFGDPLTPPYKTQNPHGETAEGEGREGGSDVFS